MTESTNLTESSQASPQRDDEGSHASVGNDVAHAGGGRTSGEVAVDDALGSGDDPH